MNNSNEVTILIADDDDGHALLIQEHLEEAGLRNPIQRFVNGRDAWAFLCGEGEGPRRDPNRPYLLLLDINMPHMNGVEVLRKIKQSPSLRTMPVIMLTTTDNPREVAECYALGCNSYVTKPVEFEQFAEVIKRLGLYISVIALAPPDMALTEESR